VLYKDISDDLLQYWWTKTKGDVQSKMIWATYTHERISGHGMMDGEVDT